MAGDPYWDNVVLAMHMDGVDGSTTFTDVKGKTATSVGAVVSMTPGIFGGSSGKFNGSSAYIGLNSSSDWNFGTDDFTLEAYIYVVAFAGSDRPIFNLRSGSSKPIVFNISDDGKVTIWGSSASAYQIKGSTTTPLSTWRHVAVSKSGTTLRAFLHGVLDGTATSTLPLGDASSVVKLGAETVTGQYFNGYIRDLRVTKGVCKYTENFTPPAATFPEYASYIAGTVKDDTGSLCARAVRAYRRSDGSLSGSTVSNAITGAFTLTTKSIDAHTVVALDDTAGAAYNALVFDNVMPE